MADRPTYEEFNPSNNASQLMAIEDIMTRVRHRKGTQVVFLSGAMGSGKSLVGQYVMADIGINQPGGLLGMTRRALPDLRDTLYAELMEHLPPQVVLKSSTVSCNIELCNGTKYISRTFSDNKFKKMRGLAPLAWMIEEATEFPTSEAYQEIFKRMGRVRGVSNYLLMLATNPDSPEHWCYRELIERAGWVNGVKTKKRKGRNLNVHVYYSITTDNSKNLPDGYIEGILATISEKQKERDIDGRWVNLSGESAYHSYDEDRNFKGNKYIVDTRYPIHFTSDFNTAEGKPMSSCFFQYINDYFHVFREFIVYKANTHSMMEEIVQDDKEPGGKGILDYDCQYIVHGDATGRSKKSSATTSDYGIIKEYFEHYTKKKINVLIQVPEANPPVKDRVNNISAYCYNALHQCRLTVYNCPTVDAGFKNTQWKKGADSVLDDSYYAQHVMDALGYGVWRATRKAGGVERLW
jgi:hypothetical protein